MSVNPLDMTRRQMLSAAAAGGIALTVPAGAVQADPEPELRAGLARLSGQYAPACFSLVSLSAHSQAQMFQTQAVVRLDWPPGMRRILVEARHTDAQTAIATLVWQVERQYAIAARLPAKKWSTQFA